MIIKMRREAVCWILTDPHNLEGITGEILIYKDTTDSGVDFYYVPIDCRANYTDYKNLHFTKE